MSFDVSSICTWALREDQIIQVNTNSFWTMHLVLLTL